MKISAILIILLCLVHTSFAISIEFMDDQCSNQSNTGIRLRVDNVGGSAIQNVELRYYFHKKQGKTPQLDVYYAPGISASIREADSETAYVEILAESIPSGYFPDQGGMSFGLHYSDWSAWDKSLDPSYQKFSTLQQNDKIALLVNGVVEQSQTESEEPMLKPVLPDDGYTLKAAANTTESIYPESKVLPIETIRGMMDTRLLNLVWNTDYEGRNSETTIDTWDIPEDDTDRKCGFISLTIMNHYYGGSLTQDEIEYHVLVKDETKVLSDNAKILLPFLHEPLNEGDVPELLKWSLNVENIITGGTNYSTPCEFSMDMIKDAINKNKLIMIEGTPFDKNPLKYRHYMVIYGYDKDHVYIGNASNFGLNKPFTFKKEGATFWIIDESQTSTKYFISFYWIPEITDMNGAERGNPLVSMDSDGDGVMDFDELERFGTDPYNIDTDGDGLGDKEDILFCARKYDNFQRVSERIEKMESYDMSCALNSDYNNDGIIDGLEDLNADGTPDNMEPWPNLLEKIISDMDDVPEDYTVYAFADLKINDGARCYSGTDTLKSNEEKFCKVASWATNTEKKKRADLEGNINVIRQAFELSDAVKGKATTNIGVGAVIGGLDSWGKVFLRSKSHIYGNLRLFPLNSEKISSLKELESLRYLDYQTGAEVSGSVELKKHWTWPKYRYMLSDFKTDSQNRTVRVASGKTLDLRDGDSYSALIVENGATLKIHSGEMFVERNLQLEPEAKVVFDNLDGSTVLHIAGDVLWKTKANTPTTDMAYWSQVASRFKLVSHTSKPIFIDGQWGGTIYNPFGTTVMGQSQKFVYGRFLARKFELHQYTKLFRVDFVKNPNPPLAVGLK